MIGSQVPAAFRVIRNALRHPLGGRRKLHTLAAIVRWQVASRLTRGPLDLPWIGGVRLLVERGMTGATGNVYFGLHEVPDMAFMVHFLRPGETLFDIGAKPRPLIASIAPKTAAPTPMPKSAPSQSAPRIVRGKTAVLADPKKIDPKPSIEPSTETRLDAPPPESEIFSGEPPPEGPRYYRAGELDERPQPIVLPEPEIADAAGPGSNQAGYLVVQVLINESGTVDRVIFLISDPDGVFDDATTRSFSAARFRPALKNGLAVKSEMIIEIKFASAASPLDAAIQAMQRQRTEKAEN